MSMRDLFDNVADVGGSDEEEDEDDDEKTGVPRPKGSNGVNGLDDSSEEEDEDDDELLAQASFCMDRLQRIYADWCIGGCWLHC